MRKEGSIDYLQTTGDRLHDLELDRILARLRSLEAATGTTRATTPAAAPSTPIVSAGVRSIAPGAGTQMFNDIAVAVSGPLTIAQSGQTITLTCTAAASPATTVTNVASAAAVGTATTFAREDHVHKGVLSVNTLSGAVTLAAGTNITLTPAGSSITIAASASGTLSVPVAVLVISPGSSGSFSWAVPSALTEWLGGGSPGTPFRTQADLTNATQARLVLVVDTGAGFPLSIPTIAVQYSTNGGSTWNYLDASSGPNVAWAAGMNAGAWATLVAGAKADVMLRIVGLGGNGSTSVSLGSIYVQVK